MALILFCSHRHEDFDWLILILTWRCVDFNNHSSVLGFFTLASIFVYKYLSVSCHSLFILQCSPWRGLHEKLRVLITMLVFLLCCTRHEEQACQLSYREFQAVQDFKSSPPPRAIVNNQKRYICVQLCTESHRKHKWLLQHISPLINSPWSWSPDDLKQALAAYQFRVLCVNRSSLSLVLSTTRDALPVLQSGRFKASL